MAAEPISFTASSEPQSDLIFLSYARADRAHVEAIAAALRARGASVWYDTSSAAGGSSYVDSSQRALRRSSLMLVFLSSSSVRSAWVAEEIRAYRSLMAREPGHKLLTIHLDKTRAPLSLAGVGAVDARGMASLDTVSLIASAANVASLALAQLPTAVVSQPAPASANGASPAAAPAEHATKPAPVASGQVFVSYARADRDRVLPIVEALRARGANLWHDNGAVHGGANWVETVRGALERSRSLLVFVSTASLASAWVEDEARMFRSLMARDPGRTLIVAHLDRTGAPLAMAGAQAVDARDLNPDDAARLIVDALPTGGYTEPTAIVEPAATPAPVAETTTERETAAPVAEVAEVATVAAAAASVVAVAAEAAPVAEAAPMVAKPMAETAPAMKVVTSEEIAPVAEVAPVAAIAPVAAAAPVASADAVVANLHADQVAQERASAAHAQSQPQWNSAIGPVVLVIVLVIVLAFALWVHAGFPLPAGWGQ